MPKSGSIRVLVVDDHPVVCRGLTAILKAEADMEVVGQAANGKQAVELFRKHQPNVTLMDLRMPVMNGVDAIREIRKEFRSAAFVVLTTYQGDEDIHRALEAGALAYLLKGTSDQELIDAIRKANAGLRYLPGPIAQTLASRPPRCELSNRELEILGLIVKGMSNRRIGETLGIAEATVKWHINLILSRLNVTDRTQAAIAALNRGIVEM
ncbi:MAG TPA: response regulator transcription factor [Bryobacteraceae bacterium]|nr:response regulator transcription factor [Bryobacteraceae bacterium]